MTANECTETQTNEQIRKTLEEFQEKQRRRTDEQKRPKQKRNSPSPTLPTTATHSPSASSHSSRPSSTRHLSAVSAASPTSPSSPIPAFPASTLPSPSCLCNTANAPRNLSLTPLPTSLRLTTPLHHLCTRTALSVRCFATCRSARRCLAASRIAREDREAEAEVEEPPRLMVRRVGSAKGSIR